MSCIVHQEGKTACKLCVSVVSINTLDSECPVFDTLCFDESEYVTHGGILSYSLEQNQSESLYHL